MITVTHTASDELSRKRWGFIYSDKTNTLILNYYAIEKRGNVRHGFLTVRAWSRNGFFGGISADDVPLPEYVIVAAKNEFLKSLEVTR